MTKRTQKESDREANTNSGRNLQNRTAVKGQLFRGHSVAQIEKCKTNESLDITWGICTRNRRSKDNLRIFMNFYGAAPKSVLGQQLPQILPHSN
jgi:hypothetical protein